MIKRNLESKILDSISYFPVTGLIGPRQVGKTTLAKSIRSKIKIESIYIDLEDPRDRIKLSDPMLFFHSNIDKLIIIDEVQLMPEIFSLLRSLIDQKRRSAMYMILGSASPVIMRESSQSLAGRIGYFELSGFNITELSSGVLDKHWLRGGFPDAYLAPDDKYWKLWLDNFIKTYIERDIPMLGLNIGPITLRNLWTMIAHNHGQVANYSNLSRSLELSSTTIKKYLDFLEYAFIIRQLPPYHINLKKRLVKSPKLYIRDSGVLHNLLNIDSFSDLESHLIKGSSWEGYAVEQILQLSNMSYQPYFYRTHQGSECDLILVRSSQPVYAVEIKYTSVPKLTKGNLLSFEDIDADRNFIITPDSDDFLISDNVRVCNLETFLEKYLKIS